MSPTITAARRWRQDAHAALRAGTLTADRGQTLREAADDWLAAARAGIVRIFHNVRESYDRGPEAARAAGRRADAARVPPRVREPDDRRGREREGAFDVHEPREHQVTLGQYGHLLPGAEDGAAI
jgi:hypothetical protein